MQWDVVVSGGDGGHCQAGAGPTRVQNVDNDAKRNLLAALSSVQNNGVYGLEVGLLHIVCMPQERTSLWLFFKA